METYEPIIGENIIEAAKCMVALANRTGDTVAAKFNDIELKTNPSEDLETAAAVITAYYSSESSRRAEAYRNSPEGKRAAADAEKRKQQSQCQMDEAMSELSSLNFSDLNAVIGWLEKVRDPSDHVGVVTPSKQIVETFRGHGYEPSVNCGKDFNGEDEENFARWLIGQALDNLNSVGAILQVFDKFAEDWRKKFETTRA